MGGSAPAASAAPPEEPRVASAPAASRVAPIVAAAPVVRRAGTKAPEVLFAKDESAALQRLTRGFTRGAVDPATLRESTTPTIAAIEPGAIVLAPLPDMSPITFDALGALAEGVRQ